MSDIAAPLPATADHRRIVQAAIGIGLYAAAFGASFGAVSVGAGLSLAQTMVLSLVLFSGASQFAFVGVATAGGSPFAAIPAALLLGVRNAFYGVPLTEILRPRGWHRLYTAHFVIDETTAMAVGQKTQAAKRYAFWATGLILFALWQVGTLTGSLVGTAIDPDDFGLDAAAPAVYLALLWPGLTTVRARVVAVGGAALAVALIPLVPAGVPVVASAAVAIIAGVLPPRATAGGPVAAGVTSPDGTPPPDPPLPDPPFPDPPFPDPPAQDPAAQDPPVLA